MQSIGVGTSHKVTPEVLESISVASSGEIDFSNSAFIAKECPVNTGTLTHTGETNKLGFEESEGLRIPDEYLDNQKFVIMRTCHGIGDWGLLSAMPRLLKEKYPNCKVYIPSTKLLEQLFGNLENNWGAWNNPFLNAKTIFDNNPYVDGYKDEIDGEVFHDHYKINNNDDVPIPLIEQMLKFWQFEGNEYIKSQPE